MYKMKLMTFYTIHKFSLFLGSCKLLHVEAQVPKAELNTYCIKNVFWRYVFF